MSNLKDQLIRLGNKKPSLRKHIKPVLDKLPNRNKKAVSDSQLRELKQMVNTFSGRKVLDVLDEEFGGIRNLPSSIDRHLTEVENSLSQTRIAMRKLISELEDNHKTSSLSSRRSRRFRANVLSDDDFDELSSFVNDAALELEYVEDNAFSHKAQQKATYAINQVNEVNIPLDELRDGRGSKQELRRELQKAAQEVEELLASVDGQFRDKVRTSLEELEDALRIVA